jgi:hypothetical protein
LVNLRTIHLAKKARVANARQWDKEGGKNRDPANNLEKWLIQNADQETLKALAEILGSTGVQSSGNNTITGSENEFRKNIKFITTGIGDTIETDDRKIWNNSDGSRYGLFRLENNFLDTLQWNFKEKKWEKRE